MTPPKPSLRAAVPSGILVVDKPSGMTSHDVVGRLRRALGTKKVGHAGTLDPMASGVLVVLVGEATKLGPYVTAHGKAYEARIAFGLATDTLDREGAPREEAEVPAWLRAELAQVERGALGQAAAGAPRLGAALLGERERTTQVPPAYSAIHVDGVRSYERARAGVDVVLDGRPVSVLALTTTAADATAPHPWVDVRVAVTKGYYVRSLARDVGARLEVPSHLAALRRTESGPFTLARAVRLDAGAEALRAAIVPLAKVAGEAMPTGHLTPTGALRTRRGQPLDDAHFTTLPPIDEPAAWFDEDGELAAVGTRSAEGFTIHRGFGPTPPAEARHDATHRNPGDTPASPPSPPSELSP